MATSINPLTNAPSVVAAQQAPTADPTSKLANEQTFLQLLVAQMRNQNPLNPTDSIQFVSQLAQFSQLEQMIALRQDADTLVTKLVPPATTPTAPAQG
jgi:flagellar basal-body rod modification protein FlgD